MADPDAQEEMFHFSRRAFCACQHLPPPCASPGGPNGSENRSSCLAHNLLTYCVRNKWDWAVISPGYFCWYQILNLALGKGFWEDFWTLTIVCVPVCLWMKREERRGTWGETQVSALHSLYSSQTKHIFFSSKAQLADSTLSEKKKIVYIKSRLQSQKSLNLQKTRLGRQICWRLSKEMDLLSCKTIISIYVFLPF